MRGLQENLLALREELEDRVGKDRRRRLYEKEVRVLREEEEEDGQDREYVNDPLDVFLYDIVDTLVSEYEITQEEAADILTAVMDALVEGGVVEEMPEEGGDWQAWTTSLMQVGFADLVREYIRSELEA